MPQPYTRAVQERPAKCQAVALVETLQGERLLRLPSCGSGPEKQLRFLPFNRHADHSSVMNH